MIRKDMTFAIVVILDYRMMIMVLAHIILDGEKIIVRDLRK